MPAATWLLWLIFSLLARAQASHHGTTHTLKDIGCFARIAIAMVSGYLLMYRCSGRKSHRFVPFLFFFHSFFCLVSSLHMSGASPARAVFLLLTQSYVQHRCLLFFLICVSPLFGAPQWCYGFEKSKAGTQIGPCCDIVRRHGSEETRQAP